VSEHPIDRGLRALGVDPGTLDPDVLEALRGAAGPPAPTSLEDAFTAHFQPGDEA
jgi:hypothetical protein